MISGATFAKLGKAVLARIVEGKRVGPDVTAESIWNSNALTLIYVVRRPGLNKLTKFNMNIIGTLL